MSDLKDFVIENGLLTKYVGQGGDVVIPEGVKRIFCNAFNSSCEITSITFPSSISVITAEPFWNDTHIKSLYVAKGNKKFYSKDNCVIKTSTNELVLGCENSVIPSNVTGIGSQTLAHCNSLINIALPKVKTIGSYAFAFCYELRYVELLTKVEKIGEMAFCDCDKLYIFAPKTSINVFKKANMMFAAAMGFLSNSEKYTNETIKEEYKKYVFAQKKRLLNRIFEDDLVAGVVFYANAGKITAKNIEKEFLAPAKAAKANQCVAFLMDFKNQNSFQESLETHFKKQLNDDPFSRANMKELWSFKNAEDGTLIITDYKGKDKDIVVPERVGKKIVSSIARGAISRYDKLGNIKTQSDTLNTINSITIPNSIISIEPQAFSAFECLEEITVSEENKMFHTKDNCLIESATNTLLLSCRSLNIPDSITTIGEGVFQGVKSLTSIAIPDNVKVIDRYAFCYCDNLTEVELPDKLTSINAHAFMGCKSLTNIIFGESLTNIGHGAFWSCKQLTSITIPNSVTIIEDYAFYYCSSLSDVTIPNSVTNIGNNVFMGCYDLIIHAPAGSYAEQYAKENKIPFVAE